MEIVELDGGSGAQGAIWPSRSTDGDSVDGEGIETTFAALIGSDGLIVNLVRNLAAGNTVLVNTVAWFRRHDDPASAEECYAWLIEQGERLAFWSVAALALGTEVLQVALDAGVAELTARRAEEQARQAQIAEELVAIARAAAEIGVFFRERNRRPVLTLERGSAGKPLWTIAFNEGWERERFWDWLKWQRSRFEEFAACAVEGDPLDLDRRLLKEMLVTEQTVKKQGLGAGGRRPLRFWRGCL